MLLLMTSKTSLDLSIGTFRTWGHFVLLPSQTTPAGVQGSLQTFTQVLDLVTINAAKQLYPTLVTCASHWMYIMISCSLFAT